MCLAFTLIVYNILDAQYCGNENKNFTRYINFFRKNLMQVYNKITNLIHSIFEIDFIHSI